MLQVNSADQTAKDLAVIMFETATLRSGYLLPDTASFGERVERMLRLSMNIPLDETVSMKHAYVHFWFIIIFVFNFNRLILLCFF